MPTQNAPQRLSGERSAAALQVGGALTAQVGAAIGATAFPIAGSAPVVAIRQGFAAIAFLVIARPPVHRMRWRQLWPALVLAASLVLMNLSLYGAVERLGLGLAVTLEFLGPLGVALAASRRALDAVLAVAAFGGVVLLTGTVPGIDPLGVVLALLGALGWAGYIVFSQLAGRRLPGLQGSAIALTLASLCTLPILIAALLHLSGADALRLLGLGVCASILSTLIPNAIDMTVLRRMRRELFGVIQSAQPALAALVGFVILGQSLGAWQIAGLVLISGVNAVAVLLAGRSRGARAPEFVDPIEAAEDVLALPDHRDPPTAPIPVGTADR
ncbi:MAG: EamA family transporter [Microbacteriaceae bacterium]|nr:EamA family transporter [Microbacteriaceae bacterium]